MDELVSTIRKRSSPYPTTNQIKGRPLPSLQSSPHLGSFMLACLVDEVLARDASGLCVLSHIPYKQIHVLIETDSQQPIHRAVLDSDLQEPIPDVYFRIYSQAVRFFFPSHSSSGVGSRKAAMNLLIHIHCGAHPSQDTFFGINWSAECISGMCADSICLPQTGTLMLWAPKSKYTALEVQ